MSSEEFSDEDDVMFTLSNPSVVERYKTAGGIANTVMAHVLTLCVVGAKLIDIAKECDDMIVTLCNQAYKKDKEMKKGSAFPCCLSVNEIASHYSPLSNDKTVLAEGDVVKIDLGCHIDGYIASMAHTAVIRADNSKPITGPKADLIVACHFAAEAAHRLLRPGNTNSQITEAVQQVASHFGVNVVEGVLSHNMRRNQIDGNSIIISKESASEHADVVTFEEFDVWCLDIVLSTGEGKLLEKGPRPAVYKRDIDERHQLKSTASRNTLQFITENYDSMPFSVRAVTEGAGNRALIGIKEMYERRMIHPYPVLYEKKGELVAQFKFTVLITKKCLDRITQAQVPHVSSDIKIEDCVEVKQILARGTNRKSAKKKNRKKKKKK